MAGLLDRRGLRIVATGVLAWSLAAPVAAAAEDPASPISTFMNAPANRETPTKGAATARSTTLAANEVRRPRKARAPTASRGTRRIVVTKDPPKPKPAVDPVVTGGVARPATALPAGGPVTATGSAGPPAAAPAAEAMRGSIETPPAARIAPARPGPTAALPAAGQDAAVARNPSFTTDGGTTRFTLDLSRSVEIDAFGLADPYRVVVDLPEVRFDLAADAARDTRGPVTSWRYGLFMTGRSRLVFDIGEPVRIERATVEPRNTAEGVPAGARLTLELRTASRDDFMAAHVRRPKETPVAEGVGILAKGDREASRPARAKPVIVLDPGHGGIDVGTRSPATGTFEKGVVLDIARLLERKLIETGRYDVRMTRHEDSFVPLGERVRFARQNHADLFLSIHADAEYDRGVRGATIYTLDDRASDAQAAALAAKENASDALAGVVPDEAPVEVADILIDLTVRETKRFSHGLARNLIDDLRQVGRLVKANPHRSANFRVLKAHDIPSVLVELGFLSNKEDEQLLMSADWRAKTTSALVASIDRFFQAKLADAPN